jgi:hypothetical protein
MVTETVTVQQDNNLQMWCKWYLETKLIVYSFFSYFYSFVGV